MKIELILGLKNEKCPIFVSSHPKPLKWYQIFLWGGSFGYKYLSNFTYHTIKFNNRYHFSVHIQFVESTFKSRVCKWLEITVGSWHKKCYLEYLFPKGLNDTAHTYARNILTYTRKNNNLYVIQPHMTNKYIFMYEDYST